MTKEELKEHIRSCEKGIFYNENTAVGEALKVAQDVFIQISLGQSVKLEDL